MVKLGTDQRGNYKAGKRLPEDVREEYGRLYHQRVEAKFHAPAETPLAEARRRFGACLAETEQRIETIRKTQRGEGIDLDHKQAHA
jgi:hypothetical protein